MYPTPGSGSRNPTVATPDYLRDLEGLGSDTVRRDLRPEERKPIQEVCKWQRNYDRHWDSGCGHTFELSGSPASNGVLTCPSCGRKIVAGIMAQAVSTKSPGSTAHLYDGGDPLDARNTPWVKVLMWIWGVLIGFYVILTVANGNMGIGAWYIVLSNILGIGFWLLVDMLVRNAIRRDLLVRETRRDRNRG